MVEQRSPKPSVACSSRVSPAKRSPLGLLFFCQRFASRTRNAIATELHSVRLWLHLTRRFANIICSLCYFSRFALSRVASPLPREVFWDFFFLSAFRESNAQRNRDGTTFRTLVVASDTPLCKYYLLALLFQSLCAFTSRVSPAKRSLLGLLFFVSVSRVERATQSRRNYIPYACGCI